MLGSGEMSAFNKIVPIAKVIDKLFREKDWSFNYSDRNKKLNNAHYPAGMDIYYISLLDVGSFFFTIDQTNNKELIFNIHISASFVLPGFQPLQLLRVFFHYLFR